jgi:cytochrome P450
MAKPAIPPGPKGTMLGGNFAEMSRDWLAAYGDYARRYGDVVSYRIGPFRSALVNEPSLIEELLLSRADCLKKPSIQRLTHPLIGDGLFLNEGESWKRRRRLLSPPFHRQRVAAYGATMVEIADRVAAEFRDGELRDLYRDMMCLTLRVVGAVLFAAELESRAAEVERVLSKAMEALSARLDTPVPLPNWIPSRGVRRLRHARRNLDRLIQSFVDERRSTADSRVDLLSVLLSVRDAESGRRLNDRQIHDEAATLFVAGFETTAITLSWAFWLLAHHPTASSRLRTELADVLGKRLPTSDDLPHLKFTECVVRETMRLYPPAWLIAREVTHELEVGPFRIPKGWTVEVSQWLMHRDSRFWNQPDRFIPERWENGLAERLPRFAYFPFGGGPRTCIGGAFAMLEAVLVLATIARRFAFEPAEGHAVKPDPGFTLRPSPGVSLRVTSGIF